jgi:hypothetical protein
MRLFASLAALLLLIALQGCGGGAEQGSSESSPAPSTAQKATTASEQPSPSQPKPAPTAPPRHLPSANPQPGSKAPAPGVPTTKGGDNSIQGFGTEGEEGPREEAISNLLAYREARLQGKWARACALASQEFREQLEALIANAKAKGDTPKPKGCPEILKLFTPEKAKAALRQRFQINEVLSFRVEEPYAYLIFKGAEGEAMFIAMNDADGGWRVNVVEPEGFGVGGS